MNKWPKSNKTQSERGTGCSKAQDAKRMKDAASMLSVDTAEVMRPMSFVGGTECASHRLQEATASRPSGKGRKVRSPIVSAALTQNATTGPHGESRSTSPESKASRATSSRSSAYRMVNEAVLARKTLLEAQTYARQAMAKLAESKAECSREHHTITTEIEAVQEELRKTGEKLTKPRSASGQDGRNGLQNGRNHGPSSPTGITLGDSNV